MSRIGAKERNKSKLTKKLVRVVVRGPFARNAGPGEKIRHRGQLVLDDRVGARAIRSDKPFRHQLQKTKMNYDNVDYFAR